MAPGRDPQGGPETRRSARLVAKRARVVTRGRLRSPTAPSPAGHAVSQDVVLVHRRTFRRFCDVDQLVRDSGILDGDSLELTIRFAHERVVDKFVEPLGFYEVSPRPASTGIPLLTEVAVQLVNIVVDGRPCLTLSSAAADGDATDVAVPAVQVWQSPNSLKLIPNGPLRPDTLYTVMLDLVLDAPGMRVAQQPNLHDADITTVADGVDSVSPFHFIWHFQTGAGGKAQADGATVPNNAVGMDTPPVLGIVHNLLVQPLDGYSKRQLLSLQADLGLMLGRVGESIVAIEHKIEHINRRLQAKAKRQLSDDLAAPVANNTGSDGRFETLKRLCL